MSANRHVFPLLIVGVAGIGFAPVLAKLAVNLDGVENGAILSPVAVAFWRMVLSVPFFFLIHRMKSSEADARSGLTPAFSPAVLLPGFIFALDLSLWHWSFEFTSVANSTLLANLSVIVVTFAGWFFFKEHVSILFLAGVIVALAGVARLVGASIAAGGDAWIGDMLGVATAVAYGSYQLSVKKLAGTFSVGRLMLWTTVISSLFLAVFALATPGRIFPVTTNAWMVIIALAFCSQIVGQGLIAFALSRLPVSLTGVVLVLQPVLAAFWGWVILGQQLSPARVLDCLIVIAGIAVAKVSSKSGK